MEYYLNEYTFRECCGEEVRACDGCDCYECETCGKLNYEITHSLHGEDCQECYIEKQSQENDS